ncbi:aminopeptidase P family protein [Alteromonas sp. ASW11-19]|uniref:Aminopeptidase P family protein n=1 Tax=Alteromonas salexigens TaxID=2982530 RepID=A0ABT2VLZ8_9ALTE|nr:M24 family metallopeptidase [Alteromonas salexigens]MCU7554345.1 aminopeptidase P family protein [Alteromonas salexigens]
MKILLSLVMLVWWASAVGAQPADGDELLPLRERAKVIDAFTRARAAQVLPDLMAREHIDMWVLIAREYNEDPVLETMLPATWMSARRRTILVIYAPPEGQPLEFYAVARYKVGTLFQPAWDTRNTPDQYQALAALIRARQPARIGINQSDHFGLADGIAATELAALREALPEGYQNRLVSAEKLTVGWLETRLPQELPYYKQLTRIGHDMIATAFSDAVITPGVTSTEDVEWWLREETQKRHLDNWFHPSVSLQRQATGAGKDFSHKDAAQIIRRGDLLHVDFGVRYLGLHSDQQQHAYVLKDNEQSAPLALTKALATGNKLQDILTDAFRAGRRGNDILAHARQTAIAQGITPTIYSHPIGLHGHGAGTTIGMWDAQQGVAGSGEYTMRPNTLYAIELNAKVDLASWDQPVRIMLEEQAFFDGDKVSYLDGRQTRLHLISSRD